MDQNLSWVIVNRKQFQFLKSNILLSCYTPLNRERSLTHWHLISGTKMVGTHFTKEYHCGTPCHTVWYLQSVNLVGIDTSLVEFGLKDLV